MPVISFKERVKIELVAAAPAYKRHLVDHEYLVCSDAFIARAYYIIDAKEENYLHLSGVNSSLSAQSFFEKCYNGALLESDFDFCKQGQTEREVKGSVRRKISLFPSMTRIFQNSIIYAEEVFVKNKITCAFATSDNQFVLGFIDTSKARPKSLIKGDGLDKSKAKPISLLLRKKNTEESFHDVVIGSEDVIEQHYNCIKEFLNPNLIPKNILEKPQKTTEISDA